MFLRYDNTMFNLHGTRRISREGMEVWLYEEVAGIPHTLAYGSEEAAAFAYGRIVTGLCGKWGCIDVTPDTITRIMDCVKSAEP